MLDGTESATNEQAAKTTASTTTGSTGAAPAATTAAKVDLPDTAWPAGGYYWTVVPVVIEPKPTTKPPAPGAPIQIRYRETELPQDACQSGRVMRFGKATPPVVTSSSRPFASGLSPKGRLTSAVRTAPSFYGTPLVAWQSVLGAQEYEIQWSKSADPWRPLGSLVTGATSSLLPLEPGSWYYRVRGYNHSLLKRPADGVVDADAAEGLEAHVLGRQGWSLGSPSGARRRPRVRALPRRRRRHDLDGALPRRRPPR